MYTTTHFVRPPPPKPQTKTARGWASVLQGNPRAQSELRAFFARPDAWSLGLCNGCQLLAALGVVPGLLDGSDGGVISLTENESGRFESRFVTVRVEEATAEDGGMPAMLLRGMEGAVLGVWSAHGEGRFAFPDGEVGGSGGLEMGVYISIYIYIVLFISSPGGSCYSCSSPNQVLTRPHRNHTYTLDRQTQARTLAQGLAPLRYVDPSRPAHGPAEAYPHNPNGSPEGIAALCSPCGRHLAIMPHPERSWLAWQVGGEFGVGGDVCTGLLGDPSLTRLTRLVIHHATAALGAARCRDGSAGGIISRGGEPAVLALVPPVSKRLCFLDGGAAGSGYAREVGVNKGWERSCCIVYDRARRGLVKTHKTRS